MGFVTSITRCKTIFEVFVEREDRENAVYYLRIKDKTSEALIRRAVKEPDCDLKKYGEILHSYFCGDSQPFESVKEFIIKKYGNA